MLDSGFHHFMCDSGGAVEALIFGAVHLVDETLHRHRQVTLDTEAVGFRR
jgi:hypothetical protein